LALLTDLVVFWMVNLDPAAEPEVQLGAKAPENNFVAPASRHSEDLQGLDPTIMLKKNEKM
jgi:hypothetical protein